MLSSKNLIKILLVDDEQDAIANLEHIFKEHLDEGIKVVGSARSTREAEQKIARLAPDAVFLDIEMPNENAFNFLERISPVNFEVVFVTAYDDYAIKAFKLNAVDYILKPISITELQQAMLKLREKVGIKRLLGEPATSYTEIASQVNSKAKNHRITLKDNNAVEVVDFKDIYFVEAQGSYIRVVFLKDNVAKEIVMSGSLTDYEELLPGEFFFRIHKSYLINCQHLDKILRDEHSYVLIRQQYTLPVSRRRYPALLEFLKLNNYYNE